MARKPRIEVEGGLYHIISRGNNRRRIFNGEEDYVKLLSILEDQKAKLPFFLYAYCLMPNHIHLLIERAENSISRIMQRVLTGYSQYYNRTYRRVGHLLQGRYKGILCQSDQYLAELVRYIHLNPVRARLARRPEDYPYSSHGHYLREARSILVDVDPVLRHFGARKRQARERYLEFIGAGLTLGRQDAFYRAEQGRILGSEEFVDSTIHRVGEGKAQGLMRRNQRALKPSKLIKAIETVSGARRAEICSRTKRRQLVVVKEALILTGRERGLSNAELARMLALSDSVVSRRYDAAKLKRSEDGELTKLVKMIEQYLTIESQEDADDGKSPA